MNTVPPRHLWVWYTPFGLGGVETYLLNMLRQTVLDGGQAWVAATRDADGPLRARFEEAGVQILDWSGFHAAFMRQDDAAPMRDRLVADLARIRPTLLALNDCNDFSMGTAALLRKLRPFCTVLDTLHIDSPVAQYLAFRQVFMDSLDGIVTTNQHVADRFRARYPGAAAPAVRYVANGVDVAPGGPRRPAGDILRLLYVGRLAQDQKRVLDLPPLLETLRDRGKAFSMTIVGEGPCRAELERDLAARGLGGQVRMAGYLPPPQVAELYLEHDVLVNLSTFEGFSMSVLEAMASGCVPVCTAVDSLDRSVFADGINCRLCPVDALRRMVDIWDALTPWTLQGLGAAALETGRKLTARNTYLAYREFIEQLRAQRPLQPWPADAEGALALDWDLARDNPWLPRPHWLRRLAQSIRPSRASRS